jgi:hypothetical protein
MQAPLRTYTTLDWLSPLILLRTLRKRAKLFAILSSYVARSLLNTVPYYRDPEKLEEE